MGGLSKKTKKIKETAGRNNLPSLLVDSGNVLFNNASHKKVRREAVVNARGLADIYQAMGYAGIAVGRFDLLYGIDFLIELEREGLPLLSANIYSDNKLVFKPYISVVVAGQKIALIGITNAPDTDRYSVSAPREALNRILPGVAETHDVIVILSNTSHKTTRELAEKFSLPKIFIGADHRKGNIAPVLVNSSLITQVDTLGRYLGVLFIEWNGNRWQPDYSQELTQLHNRLKNEKWQRERLSAISDKSTEHYKRRKGVVEKNISTLSTEITALKQRQDQAAGSSPMSLFRSEMLALKPATPVDRKIEAMVLKLKDEKNRARLKPQ